MARVKRSQEGVQAIGVSHSRVDRWNREQFLPLAWPFRFPSVKAAGLCTNRFGFAGGGSPNKRERPFHSVYPSTIRANHSVDTRTALRNTDRGCITEEVNTENLFRFHGHALEASCPLRTPSVALQDILKAAAAMDHVRTPYKAIQNCTASARELSGNAIGQHRPWAASWFPSACRDQMSSEVHVRV